MALKSTASSYPDCHLARRQSRYFEANRVVRLEIVDPVRGDDELRSIRTLDVLFLAEVPKRELDVLPRATDKPFEIAEENTGSPRIGPALRVQ